MTEKKLCLDVQYKLRHEKHSLEIKISNKSGTLEHRKDMLLQLETQIEDTNTQLSSISQRVFKMEAEKKKHAAQKKFKDAQMCQQHIK